MAKGSLSIQLKATVFMAIIALLILAAIGWSSYRYSTDLAMREAKEKTTLIGAYMGAQIKFFRSKQRPLLKQLLEKDRFYPEIMSGSAIYRGIANIFHKMAPGYQIRQASVDPFVETNQATPAEVEIIKKFQTNKKLQSTEGITQVKGKNTFYSAKAFRVKKKCLKCHGNPSAAPKDQQEIYGTERGYNWKVGDNPGTTMVYVPVAGAMERAKKGALTIFGIGAGLLVIFLGVIWLYLGRAVFKPIRNLTEAVDKLSIGEDLETPLKTGSTDEVGQLTKSVDRLRISLTKLMDE